MTHPTITTTEHDIPRALNEREAAEILGLSVQTLRNHRARRRGIPYVKLGRRVLYLDVDIRRHLAAHRIDPTT